MIVERIELCWFRGAAQQAILNAKRKSVVMYGDTACGKSSFVDAVEYIITKGKVGHLRHEYSGTHLCNSIRNTETPEGEDCTAKICFENEGYVEVAVPESGRIQFNSSSSELLEDLQGWDVKKHILRQDEVSDFIRSTKSEKYSTLSPLLGLQAYEDLAQNIMRVRESVLAKSNCEMLKGERVTIQSELIPYFTSFDPIDVKARILEKANKYMKTTGQESLELASNMALKALDNLLQDKEPAVRRYVVTENIAKSQIREKLKSLIESEEELAQSASAYIDYKIPILENAERIIELLDDSAETIECPACGREIPKADFKSHLDAELSVLKKVRETKNRNKQQKQEFVSTLSSINSLYKGEKAFLDWLSLPENRKLKESFAKLGKAKTEDPDSRWSPNLINSLKRNIEALMPLIEKELTIKPPTTQAIVDDYKFFQAALKVPGYVFLKDNIAKVDLLLSTLDEFYLKTREEIGEITKQVLKEISSEISRIWTVIHPGQPIEDVHLTPSNEADKAIEVCLKFYGRPQPSPRLTLSEGYRNSLGLSIFLALANQEGMRDKPIFLDDIVSSLDREHRGMISDLLCRELSDRQVLLFTHDREWFDELKNRLEPSKWDFYMLKKWVSPSVGIEVLPSSYTFSDAEGFLPDHPKSSGNAVRAIMDTELPKAAEKLELSMPYRYGNHNDHRMASDFLTDFISQGQKKFNIKKGDRLEVNKEALDAWKEANELLVTWANRASHGKSLTLQEAQRLIAVCKKALSCFSCPSCGKKVGVLRASEYVQCECGALRWKI